MKFETLKRCARGFCDPTSRRGAGKEQRNQSVLRTWSLFFGLVLCQATMAGNLDLTWDPVADPRVAVYQVHFGSASGQYDDYVEVASTSATVAGPAFGETLYYAVRACDAERANCSGFSNEVSKAVTSPPPTADFHGNMDIGYVPFTVLLTDNSSGDITRREWTLGDGTVITGGSLVTHTYTAPGVYTVRLMVEGPGGSDVQERKDYVYALAPTPESYPGGFGPEPGFLPGDSAIVSDPADGDSGDRSGAAEPTLEFGELSVDHEWQWVPFRQPFADPVVVVTAPSANGREGTTVRVDGVSPSGFYVRLQEWDYLDGWHVAERLGYLVLERGRHQLADGSWVEAGTVDTDAADRFEPVDFTAPFRRVPVVLTAVVTDQGVNALTTRLRAIETGGFEVQLQGQESSPRAYHAETVAYVAWEPSAGVVDGHLFEVGHTAAMVDHRRHRLAYQGDFATAPVFLAGMQTTRGTDPANLRWTAKDQAGVDVWVAEEQSADRELWHAPEVVGYLAIGEAGAALTERSSSAPGRPIAWYRACDGGRQIACHTAALERRDRPVFNSSRAVQRVNTSTRVRKHH